MVKHAIQNFQIPVIDFDRAIKFYSTIMGYKLEELNFRDAKLGVFRYNEENGISGTIIQGSDQEPSKGGTLIYLYCENKLEEHLSKVGEAGGEIHIEKTKLGPDMGYFAVIHDTEGNRVGLYSRK
ncbi:MAG: VOC family protein [Balneolaceae bacterium]|nr:VOC family protein [Balneolaceae bacterium]